MSILAKFLFVATMTGGFGNTAVATESMLLTDSKEDCKLVMSAYMNRLSRQSEVNIGSDRITFSRDLIGPDEHYTLTCTPIGGSNDFGF